MIEIISYDPALMDEHHRKVIEYARANKRVLDMSMNYLEDLEESQTDLFKRFITIARYKNVDIRSGIPNWLWGEFSQWLSDIRLAKQLSAPIENKILNRKERRSLSARTRKKK